MPKPSNEEKQLLALTVASEMSRNVHPAEIARKLNITRGKVDDAYNLYTTTMRLYADNSDAIGRVYDELEELTRQGWEAWQYCLANAKFGPGGAASMYAELFKVIVGKARLSGIEVDKIAPMPLADAKAGVFLGEGSKSVIVLQLADGKQKRPSEMTVQELTQTIASLEDGDVLEMKSEQAMTI